ncbi:MAG: T9SS type A sorting domain-containing protein [Bacteroidales bacterium]|nr:T9SS type A sorting domain-containing protein [Bacteroidales bacterium]
MKKFLLFGAFALLFSGFALGGSITIINSGFTFSPDNVIINVGDTVNFQLASIHNAVEVSETTWNADGNTPLPGFSLPFGGGQVTELTAGVHFYVCTPHASGGMKGKITVNGPSGIGDNEAGIGKINIFPNPTRGKFTLQINGSGSDQQTRLEIFNILGEKIADVPGFVSQASNEIDLSSVPDGIYFIRINDRKKIYTEELIKQ